MKERIEELENRIKELEQINEEHRKINGELREENEILTQARYSLDRVDLEERINKAIEYINISLRDSFENDKYPLNGEDFEHLLNILQGSDE